MSDYKTHLSNSLLYCVLPVSITQNYFPFFGKIAKNAQRNEIEDSKWQTFKDERGRLDEEPQTQ